MNKYPVAHKKRAKPYLLPLKQTATSSEDSDDEGGFSKWLQTSEGARLMWYFVIANSSIVFLSMTWPKIQKICDIICGMFMIELT